MANQPVAGEHLRDQALPRTGVCAFFYFQSIHGAIFQPAADQRGHHAGGVPGGCADAALQRRLMRFGCNDEAHAQARGDAFGESIHVDGDLGRKRCQRWCRIVRQVGVGGVFDEERPMLARDGDEFLSAPQTHHPAQRIVQRGHGIDGAHASPLAQ